MTPDPPPGNPPPDPSGVSLTAGRNVNIGDGAMIAGRDIDRSVRSGVRLKPGSIIGGRSYTVPSLAAAAIVGLLVLASAVAAPKIFGGLGGVAAIPGAAGAKKTVEQLKQAEIKGDVDSRCTLAQPDEPSCPRTFSNALAQAPRSYRGEVERVGIGAGSSGTTDVMLLLDGKKQGTVPMLWARNRWQISPGGYSLLTTLGGTLFLSVLDMNNGASPLSDLLNGLSGQGTRG